MPRMPILANESNPPICLPDSLLATFYMEDYTVLGLRVGNSGAAIRRHDTPISRVGNLLVRPDCHRTEKGIKV